MFLGTWTVSSRDISDVTGLQEELDSKAPLSNVLVLDNAEPFVPDADYEPATKKYVDEASGGGVKARPFLIVMRTGLTTTADLFQKANGFSLVYHGEDFTLSAVIFKQRLPDTSALQPTVALKINGADALTSAVSLPVTGDTEAPGTLDGIQVISDGDVVTFPVVQGTNADGADVLATLVGSL